MRYDDDSKWDDRVERLRKCLERNGPDFWFLKIVPFYPVLYSVYWNPMLARSSRRGLPVPGRSVGFGPFRSVLPRDVGLASVLKWRIRTL